MKKRHKIIIEAFRHLGGEATLEELARKTGFHVNGLSQSMPAVEKYVNIEFIGGEGRYQKYRTKE